MQSEFQKIEILNGLNSISVFFKDKTTNYLKNFFNIKSNSKQINRILSDKMLQYFSLSKQILKENYFEVKAIKFSKNDKIKESISFPSFTFNEIYETSWEDSKIKNFFECTTFCFFIFKQEKENYVFKNIKLWKMPNVIISDNVKKVYNETRNIISSGKIVKEILSEKKWLSNFPGPKFDYVIHVRPHARNSYDVYKLPIQDKITMSNFYPKHCFWIKNSFLEKILKNDEKTKA